MKSILYVRLPCRPIYPGGVIALADFIHSHQPEIGQHILDLALIEKGRRKDILARTIKDFSPDIIAFSLRDIQIFSPDENDDGLITAFKFYYGNIRERIPAALKGLRYLLGYRQSIRENLSYVNGVAHLCPDKRIVLGGGAVTVFAQELLPLLGPGILCVIGEGEETLLKVISGKTNEEIVRSERVVYKDKDGSIHKGKGRSPLRLEDDEAIDFDYIASIFPDFSKYLKGTIGITTKRGCPHQCIFCLYNYIEGKKVRYRPARVVLREIESLYFDFGVRNFYFTDSQFIPGREALGQVEAILDGIIGKGLSINWQGYLRIEAIDQGLAKKMVESGLLTLELSIGSGCQRIVDALRLGLRLADVLDKAKLIKRAGFKGRVVLNYSLNAPYETKETLKESIDFYHRMVEIFERDRVYPFVFFLGIQPHTELASLAIKQGILREGDNFLSLSPFMAKRLIYNPHPLDALIAKSFLKAKRGGENNTGARTLNEIERRLDARDRA